MNPDQDDLRRWRETTSDPSSLPARAADLADAVRDVPPLSSETLARIKVDVLSRRSRPGRGLPLGLRAALLAAVVLVSAATASGTMILWRRHVAARMVIEPLSPTTRATTSSTKSTKTTKTIRPAPVPAAVEPAVEPATEPDIAPAVASVPAPRPGPAHPRRLAVATPSHARAAGDAAPTTTEAQLLGVALSRLRQDHDPAGALTVLDQFAHDFPHGVLTNEALSARLEAVIQLDDRKTALRLLDGRSAFAGRLGLQFLLTRAELRASAGRYAEALADFDRALAPAAATAPVDAERALYGRAICLGHLGRDDRARADLTAYQRRFPDGKHAAEVARLLKSTVGESRP